MSNRTNYNIKEDDYEKFVEQIGVSDELPATYQEWIDLKKDKNFTITITFQEVKDYVIASGLEFNTTTLGAYAAATDFNNNLK